MNKDNHRRKENQLISHYISDVVYADISTKYYGLFTLHTYKVWDQPISIWKGYLTIF